MPPKGAKENPFPTLPAEFGRYRVLKLLGRGGMGAVYLAQDTQLGRQVALKIPFFDASDAQKLERFAREARSAAALHHPNICTVFDAGKVGDRPFITMAFVPGKPLDGEIAADRPMPPERAATIVRSVAVALDYAHRHGVVHRDLKPANVMLAENGEPVVMDFGLAKIVGDEAKDAHLTQPGAILGTPAYMSPEQVMGDPAASAPGTDVYSLGVILFQLLTGRIPFTGGSLQSVLCKIMTEAPPRVLDFRPDADPRLEAICRTAMAKLPAERFASMAAFAEALGSYLNPPLIAVPLPDDPTETEWPEPPPKRAGWFWPTIVAVVLVAVGGLLAVVGPRLRKPSEPPPVVERSDPKPQPTPTPPPVVVLGAENSEWAGLGTVRNDKGERPVGGTWKFTARTGPAFRAAWRSGAGFKRNFEGVIDQTGRIALQAHERVAPDVAPREEIKGSGEVGPDRLTIDVEESDGTIAHVEFKRLPDGGEGFQFQGRWQCHHRPRIWTGVRTVEGNEFIDFNNTRGTWERDGGLIIAHFPGGGREWLVIDPKRPNELTGYNGNGQQAVTWVRQ